MRMDNARFTATYRYNNNKFIFVDMDAVTSAITIKLNYYSSVDKYLEIGVSTKLIVTARIRANEFLKISF